MNQLVRSALLLPLIVSPVFAQTASLKGRILDGSSHAPVVGARVSLFNLADTTQAYIGVTAEDGTFSFAGLEPRTYRFDATRLGYALLRFNLRVTGGAQSAGVLAMTATALPQSGITVHGVVPAAEQKADTTEFNAQAVKTNPDATAEELVQKLPGVTVDNNGSVKHNGEQIQQVLVDGRPFFGNDPTIALRNLPADVIDRIQVFDKLSDQAEFTGFDDGNAQKTMNIVLRADRRYGQFGKAYGGGGTDSRYLAGGSGNVLRGANRVSLIELSDNINQQNFSQQDLLGVLNTSSRSGALFAGANGRRGGFGRGGGGGGGGFGGFGGGGQGGPGGPGGMANFLVGQQDGLSTTNSVGSNAATTLGRLTVNQSLFFNGADNQNTQGLTRDYAIPQDSIAHYTQGSGSRNRNTNERYDARIEFPADSSNSIVDLPRLNFQDNHATSELSGDNLSSPGALLSHASSATDAATTGHDLSNHLVLRHKFAARGRTVSVDLGASHDLKSGTSTSGNSVQYAGADSVANDTLDYRTGIRTTTAALSARLAYTEPIGRIAMAMLSYTPSVTRSTSDNHAFTLDPVTGAYALPDTSLSIVFSSRTTAQNAGLGLMARERGMNLMANVAYQRTSLQDEETFPYPTTISRTFDNVLPSFSLNRTLNDHSNLRLFAFTSARPPSISQLQSVVDQSNPLSLTTGNPDLRPAVNTTLTGRYSNTNAVSGRGFFLLLSMQQNRDYIGNSTFTAARDSSLAGGVTLKAGSQLVQPVNLDGQWTVNTFTTFSHPVGLLRSVFNVNGGVTWSRTPGLVNALENFASATTYTVGQVLSSNISPNVDFTLSYSGSWNLTRNSTNAASDSRYYDHTIGLKSNLIGWHGIVLRNELSNVLYSGLGAGYDQDIVLWNVALGEKFFAQQRGELRLTANDVLNQNKSVNQTVSESYVENTRNLTLRPYVMLQFTYSLR